MSRLLTLDDLEPNALAGARVLVRVDFNVPLADGKVLDATRIDAAVPTIRELTVAGARVVLCSHCGRPKGERRAEDSLRPAAETLAERLGRPVAFADDCIGSAAQTVVSSLADGEVALLENLRFHRGETSNDPLFADALAQLADVFVGDAFGAAHRAHASVVGVALRLRHKAAGRLLAREVQALSRLLGDPERPYAALVGGAKIEGKIDTLVNLLPRLDHLLVGGGMANTFLAAQGSSLGRSLVERERLTLAGELLDRAAKAGVEVHLPTDLVVTDDLGAPSYHRVVDTASVADDAMAVDVGPATRATFSEVLAGCRTVFWNGPMGVFEKPPFDAGTRAMAAAVGAVKGFTVLGGGETVAAAKQAGVAEAIGHVSTGGGASLELLAGKHLPGVAALEIAG